MSFNKLVSFEICRRSNPKQTATDPKLRTYTLNPNAGKRTGVARKTTGVARSVVTWRLKKKLLPVTSDYI